MPAMSGCSTPGAAAPTRVTHVFDYLARDFKLARQEAIQWKGADGVTVEGLLTYPVDYAAGQRYPLAVITHGGPQASDKYGLGATSDELQVLAGKGYAVLQPNYRGSTGYGDPFLRDMIGHYFQNAHLDVMTGVDEVIRRGIADPGQAGEDGLERRRPHDEQDHHVHRSLQGGGVRRRRRRTGSRCTRRATSASSGRRGSAARRGRRTRRSRSTGTTRR